MRLLYVMLLSGSISFLYAQGQKAAASAAKPPAKKTVAAPAEKLMEGMLVSIDMAKKTFVVNLRGKEYAFQRFPPGQAYVLLM
jgi:hypothetical protein